MVESGVDRRHFLSWGAKGTAATATAWYLGGKDLLSPDRIPTIVTPVGTFHFLYERHDKGILPSDIPEKQFDFFFREGIQYSPGGFNVNGSETPSLINTFFNHELAAEIAGRNTKIIFADILTPEYNQKNKAPITPVRIAEALAGLLSLCGALGLREKETTQIPADNKPLKIARRKLAQLLGICGVTLAIDSTAPLTLRTAFMLEAPAATKRVLGRINALSSHFHPEEYANLFRNAIWAHKLLSLSEKTKLETGKTPVTICNVGAAHQGLEDLLLAGRSVCEMIILAYPDDFLITVAVDNFGIEGLCSSFIVQTPQLEQLGPDIDTDLQRKIEKKLIIDSADLDSPAQEQVIRDFISALKSDDTQTLTTLLLKPETFFVNEFPTFVKKRIDNCQIGEIRWLSDKNTIVVLFKDEPECPKTEYLGMSTILEFKLSKTDNGTYQIADISVKAGWLGN